MTVYQAFPNLAETKSQFKKIFMATAPHQNRYTVFSDLVFFMAASLKNSLVKLNKNLFDQDIENEYLKKINEYKKEDQNRFCELYALAVLIADQKGVPADNLGEFFMEMEFTEDSKGQFFTPNEISLLMAEMQMSNAHSILNEKGFISICDPACGAGSTLLACITNCMEKGLNPNKEIFIQGTDIDRTVALMCYVQLSLWHIPCEILVGNSLNNHIREVWRSPAYHLGFWKQKIKNDKTEYLPKKENEINFILIGESYT